MPTPSVISKITAINGLVISTAAMLSILGAVAYWFFYPASSGESLESQVAFLMREHNQGLVKELKEACRNGEVALAEELQSQLDTIQGTVTIKAACAE